MENNKTLSLLNDLCQTRGFRLNKGGSGEEAIARRIAEELKKCSWLTVTIEEVETGFFNVLAFDGDPAQTEMLIVGHLDTVTPSPGWTKTEFSTQDGRYYALGAVDTRGGIAACIAAIEEAGPTRGVGYLFYGDEEVNFVGMKDYVARHPEVSPKFGLSVCGGKGEAYLGWRGCTEMEFLIEGMSGHASRPKNGTNAAEAIADVMESVRSACVNQSTALETAANIAAVHAGSFDLSESASSVYTLGLQEAPPLKNVANKIPNRAWALLDVRPGGSAVNSSLIQSIAQDALERWNEGKTFPATLTTHLNFEMPSYLADRERIDWLFTLFQPVHAGGVKLPGETGFIDVTLIADRHQTQFMCLSPRGGNEHSADEYVSVESVIAYRDCVKDLLSRYKH